MTEPTIIEGEAVEVTTTSAVVEAAPQRSLPAARPAVGIFELGVMDDEEYDRSVAVIKKGIERVRSLMHDLLVPGVDVMDFSGDAGKRDPSKQRKGLLKPGSESLATFFHLVPEFATRVQVTTFDDGSPDRIDVDVEALAHYGDVTGPVVGAGSGAASSHEIKYRWRNSERTCPTCSQPTIIKGKAEYGGGWVCFKKKGGCGAKFDDGDPAVEGQAIGRAENDEPHELRNTLVKMGTKRAWTDCVIRTLNASSLFTQDVEDMAAQRGGGDYGGGWDDDDRSQDRASASNPAAGARSASQGPITHIKGDEWRDGDPQRFALKLEEKPAGYEVTAAGLPVLRLATKAGNSKHVVMVDGPMAQWANIHATDKSQELVVEGVRYLYQWENGKPPAKRVRDVTRIAMRDAAGAWQVFPAASGEPVAAGASANPPSGGDATPEPSQTTEPQTSSGTPSTPPGPPADAPKADPAPGPTSSATGAPATASDPDPTTTSPSDDGVEFPNDGAVAQADAILDIARAVGTPGAAVDVVGDVIESHWATTPGGARYVAMRLLVDGYDHHVAMGPGMLDAATYDDGSTIRWKPGSRLRVKGTWNNSGKAIVANWALLA